MSDAVDNYNEARAAIAHSDRRFRSFAAAAVVIIAVVVIAASLVTNHLTTTRQLTYHRDQVAANARVTCEIATLNSILAELAASQQAAEHHQTPPVFHYPRPC